jgi:hypothetical protein
MRGKSGTGTVLAVGLLIGACGRAEAHDEKAKERILFIVDQSSGDVSYRRQSCPAGCVVGRADPGWTSGPDEAVDDKATLPTGVPIVFEVTNTNTALYAFAFDAKKFEADEITVLKGFTKALGGYLPDAAKALVEAKAVTQTAPTGDVKRALENVHNDVLGENGLMQTDTAVVHALEDMANGSTIDDKRKELRVTLNPRIGFAAGQPSGLDDPWSGHLLARKSLVDHLKELADAVATKANSTSEALLKAAGKVLDSSGDLLDRAHAVERLAFLALNARPTWFSKPVTVTLGHGRDVTLTVAARKIAAVARVADATPVEVAVKISPDWVVRPAVGLTFLASTGSSFTNFTAEKDSAGAYHVAESGHSDQRFTYGLTLALTPRWLDFREKGGWAVWIPELTVNPSSDVKAVAVGAGVSFFKIVKLGGGLLWTKHKVLDGQSVGDALANDSALKTRDVYGSPHGYIGLSIIGWPPFVKE